jgi:hypothetical protein
MPDYLIISAGDDADWGKLVGILVFALVTWIATMVKKRQEQAAQKPGTPMQREEEEGEEDEVEPAEILGSDEPTFRSAPPMAPPPIRQYAERTQYAGRSEPPIAPAARPATIARPPIDTRMKQPRPRIILAESPTLRASDIETPVVLPIARARDSKPLAREEDMLDAFGRPSRAAVQEKLRALPPTEHPAATPAAATLALLRQLKASGSPLQRQAILLSEVLAPPLALRHLTPGLPPMGEVPD